MSVLSREAYFQALARVTTAVGLNIQPGQELLIRSPIESAQAMPHLAREAYRLGAKHVEVYYFDLAVDRAKMEEVSSEHLAHTSNAVWQDFVRVGREGGATITVHGEDPEGLDGVDPARRSAVKRAVYHASAETRGMRMRDMHPWCVICIPTLPWARKVFPDLSDEAALEGLFESTARAALLDRPDPVAAWRDYAGRLARLARHLDKAQFDHFVYRGPGIDLTVGMSRKHRWMGATSTSDTGIAFIANIPTYEVFSAPDRLRVDGRFRSSRPLVYQGNDLGIVEFEVSGGRIVSARAEKADDTLQSELDLDENARYFGEISLVDEDSPIAREGLVFHDGLYDENAGCHLAFGAAYAHCLEGAAAMTDRERIAAGLNVSKQHLDVTIGSAELDVDAVAIDGTVTPIIRGGRFSEVMREAMG